jgi:diguanylate cyclase (GGDEF)-like protein/PAS domain S-box-containing protein
MTVASEQAAPDSGAESLEHTFDGRKELLELRREHASLSLAIDAHSMVTITDSQGNFVKTSGYTREALLASNYRALNSGTHSAEFWKDFWDTLHSGHVWQGEICNRSANGQLSWMYCTIAPMFDGERTPQRYVSVLNDITIVRQAASEIHAIAYSDPLTGLANRAAMIEKISSCVVDEAAGACALITVSFEDFQLLNDAFGYTVGDRLIATAAQRLLALERQPDLLARIDPDVFGLVFHDLGTTAEGAAEQAEILANHIIAELNQGLVLDSGASIQPAIQVGYGLSAEARSLGGAAVLNQAEIARHRSLSSRGMQQPVRFSLDIMEEMQQRVGTLFDLRKAVDNRELRLFQQPIVDVNQATVGYELLLRWQHPQRGLVSPIEFIPLAEQSGLILEIGDWVVDEACRILAECSENRLHSLPLSINISEYQLRVGTFADRVSGALQRHSVRPDRLRIEVTETLLHVDIERSIAQLEQLRELGVRISLDDFGTGFSSLSYLQRLPVQEVKIDRSFVAVLEHDDAQVKFVAGIVNLAHMLGLTVVAEGVETEAQFERLQWMGTDHFQGYLFGKPEPVISG